MKVYIVRHTAVDVPVGTYYGQTDVPLKNSFEQEAKIVKQNLEKASPDAIFSSPLTRCRRLASYCYPDADIAYRDRLKELHFGDWEMRLGRELDTQKWFDDIANKRMPQGESFQDMYERVSSFFDEVSKENYDSIVVFAHGGVIHCTSVYFGETTLDQAYENMAQYGEVLEFIID